jgi:hypothetical protein
MNRQIEPEGMLGRKPGPTFPDHALGLQSTLPGQWKSLGVTNACWESWNGAGNGMVERLDFL